MGVELRAEILIMQECVFGISDIDESGVQSGHDTLNSTEKDVAYGKRTITRIGTFLCLEFYKATFLQDGDGYLAAAYIDN
jgi:hypothetical protein